MLEMPPFRGAGLTVYRIVPVILASLTVWRIFIRSAFRRFQRRKAFFTTSNILTSFLPLLTLRFSLSTVYNITYLIGYASNNPKKSAKKMPPTILWTADAKKSRRNSNTACFLLFLYCFIRFIQHLRRIVIHTPANQTKLQLFNINRNLLLCCIGIDEFTDIGIFHHRLHIPFFP